MRGATLLCGFLFCLQWGAAPAFAKPIRVGYTTVISSAGLFLALDRGYFRDYGLEVEAVPFRATAAAMNALLARGELDVGGGNITAGLWNANAEGEGIKIVADKGTLDARGHSYVALMVRADLVKSGRYRGYADLKGMRMAYTAMGGTSQEIVAERMLRAGGLDPKQVSVLKMSYADMHAAFRAKELDATLQVEPFVAMGEQEGVAVRVAPAYDVHPGQHSGALFYSARFAKRRPEEAVKFMAAYLRGVRDYLDAFDHGHRREDAIRIINRYTEPVPEETWKRMVRVGLHPDGRLRLSSIEEDLAWYQRKGYVSAKVSAKAVVDDSFVEKALRLTGKYEPKRK